MPLFQLTKTRQSGKRGVVAKLHWPRENLAKEVGIGIVIGRLAESQ